MTPCLHIKDGNTEVYAKLGETTDSLATDLRVNYDGTTYAVLRQNEYPPIGLKLVATGGSYGTWSLVDGSGNTWS